ncbi:MAG: PIG-L family deacetylase [Burkholderiales bacterium]|nr:PIG-L family deacetylase [Burkholderiales bacterium]
MRLPRGDAPPLIHGEGTPGARWLAWSGWRDVAITTADELAPPGARVVIAAPHPDDEILGSGALLRRLALRGTPAVVVAVTDGTASHPGSPLWTVEHLAATRPRETRAALMRLQAGDTAVVRAGLPDGAVGRHVAALRDVLAALLRPGDLLVATWRGDGHPDHEAVGDAAARAAAETGARLAEVPVWAWHWATPGDARLPWARARRLAVAADEARAKARAMAAFRSQTQPDATTRRPAVLGASALARAAWPHEAYFL